MTLGDLENPVRITWDLFGSGYAASQAVVKQVLERLVEARPFFVMLEQQPARHPLFREVVERLSEFGTQMTVMTDGAVDEVAVLAESSPEPVELLLRVESCCTEESLDIERLARSVVRLREAGLNPGISMMPLKSNIGYLKNLFDLCHQLKIPRFKLPNIRIDDNFQAVRKQILRPDDLKRFRKEFSQYRIDDTACSLEIHDLFLWEILAPDRKESRSEYGGCQAGNSLAHVRANGDVWPCVTWPESIGSLLNKSFADIWASAERQRIRESISAEPEGCSGCRDYRVCFGGCRGLSKCLGIDGGLDPMCDGAR